MIKEDKQGAEEVAELLGLASDHAFAWAAQEEANWTGVNFASAYVAQSKAWDALQDALTDLVRKCDQSDELLRSIYESALRFHPGHAPILSLNHFIVLKDRFGAAPIESPSDDQENVQ